MSTPWAGEKERQASQGGWAVRGPAQWRPSRPWSHPPGPGPDEQANTCQFSKVIHFYCSKNPNFKILTMLKEEFPRNILDWTISNHGLPWWLSWWRIRLQRRRPRFSLWLGKILWRREWLPTSVFVPGEFHGQRSVAGYSPWGHRVRHDVATKPPHKQPAIV